jgi:hypothetical protein
MMNIPTGGARGYAKEVKARRRVPAIIKVLSGSL